MRTILGVWLLRVDKEWMGGGSRRSEEPVHLCGIGRCGSWERDHDHERACSATASWARGHGGLLLSRKLLRIRYCVLVGGVLLLALSLLSLVSLYLNGGTYVETCVLIRHATVRLSYLESRWTSPHDSRIEPIKRQVALQPTQNTHRPRSSATAHARSLVVVAFLIPPYLAGSTCPRAYPIPVRCACAGRRLRPYGRMMPRAARAPGPWHRGDHLSPSHSSHSPRRSDLEVRRVLARRGPLEA